MRALFDTHLVIWIAEESRRLSPMARQIYIDPETMPVFSVATIWEAAIKSARRRPGFDVDPHILRQGLLEADWEELPVLASHAIATAALPAIHHDPFDRMLVAQARVENMVLLTSDKTVARYAGPVQLV